MRIAYVCADPGIPVFGQKGCSIHVQEVIRALHHQGATVELFAVRWGGDPPADLADVPLHALPPVPKGDLARRETAALGNNYPLRAALEQADPFDAVYERYSLWSHSAMEFAQSQGITALLEVNAPLIEEQARHRGLIQHQAARRVAERAFQSATAIIAVSEQVKQYVTGWVDGDRVRVIPNGVNHHRFAEVPFSQSATESRSSTFTVGFVGSLKPWHGLAHLVNAFDQLYQRVPQARLLIVGDGPERDRLEVQLVERRLQSVARCTGAVLADRIPELLAQMDVAVAPYPASPDFYFSPLKVVEYMAAGLPVVVSDIGQLRHLVVHGVTGLLCPPGDENALSIALERLWRSPDLRRSLGRSARRQVLARHTWDGVAEQILAIARSEPVGCIRAAMHRL
ncbi:glycosyltransferase family 4 protein [Nodosilinea sp. AN01ver1]|uniref:glycosyltransferase family 4 protein n=1 Tax=Nodosilinea sp. AN01ver1 TaxID=3423362 RepID=UPI003D31BDA7